ncbi:PAS domain S-box protein [Reichenbachiella agarivorans]|uniref:histidine kinase n=1 Tax=Reichenbachiella agarivorans TaxID=2979464 RepID=A0ABY6CRR8_9BACT|nr:ATP-binding protein [Reichenbachiella agarivorans]UXP32534.1 PAS domain S-box protein [Reichenbachiella agarivorans]
MFENNPSGEKQFADGLLKSILDTSFLGIMTFKSVRNQTGQIIDFEWLFVNDVAVQIVGKPAAALVGSRMLDLLPTNKETGLFDRYVQVVETGEVGTFEQYYSGENIHKWFKIAAIKLDDGFTVSFEDISHFKSAVLDAKIKERKYQRLFEESIDAILLMDESYGFVETNQSLQHLFGHLKEELKAMKVSNLFFKETDFMLFKEELRAQQKVEEMELVLLDKWKRKRYCLINCVSIRDEEGNLTYLAVIRDLTKRRQASRELVQAEKLAMTGKIARTIAHEVRNPLTNLTLALEQLKEEIPADVEDANLYFDIISRNAERIGKLITDLLNSSKPKELSPVKQSLNALVKESLDLVKDRLKLKNMAVVEEYASDLPDIPLDGDQFKVALLNMFINAIEAMEAELGKLQVFTYREDNYVILEISDNGKGMTSQELSNLFQPYFTGKKEGTGLGLTTVQNIIHSHKGRIEAESEVGAGTSFYITFKTQS